MPVDADPAGGAKLALSDAQLGAGACLAEISDGLVHVYRRFYGRGPTRAKTIAEGNVVTTVLEEILTTVEETLARRGLRRLVVEVRSAFQEAMEGEFVGVVEAATGRTVASYTAGVDVDNKIATETFVLAPLESESDAEAGSVPAR